MIVAQRKPFEEIMNMLKGYKKVLNVGCGTCVAVCLAGGEKEVTVLNTELDMARKLKDNPIKIDGITIERQCDREYLAELDSKVDNYEAVVSMACGVGVQFLAERFPQIPVYPMVDTSGLAANQAVGWYEERCRSCNKCVLGMTGGICPVTMCAKGIYNGPCGGTNNGSCEIDTEQPCAWFMIYERLERQGRLDNILELHAPVEWLDQTPRTLVQPGYKKVDPEDLV
ncbi:methylenetetrahydrofolate reductase C-terminal domain-containing protein [Desulfococcaceae bacterium HSG7]|nr:methylenetetrahydrofolate reductase C-terminal domain-containing protein [Desulfococcaceae bacterium HSG7]